MKSFCKQKHRANTDLGHCGQKEKFRAGEMAQRLRALAALSDVLSSILSNHMVTHNHL